jgi:2-isopropylmalate synthase
MPDELARFVKAIMEKTDGIEKVKVSVHCHNDLGLAVANSLAAVRVGIHQIECAVNGLGERAGNAALEELAMALHTRRDFYGAETGIVTREISRTSSMVSRSTGMVVQHNKAIVCKNAFAHESGIHQDGGLKERSTYEIISP